MLKYCILAFSAVVVWPADAQTNAMFRNLDACRASEHETKAEADRAEATLTSIAQPLSQAFSDALDERNIILSKLSSIRSACSKLAIAEKAIDGRLKKESLASQTSQMNELHELLSDGVLKAVPSGTTRKIQERNLSAIRSKMAELSNIMDNSVAAIGQPISTDPVAVGSRPTFASYPNTAVLGSGAAASLTAEVAEWKIQEAERQEQLRLAESARQAKEAILAAENQRLAEAEYRAQVAAADERRQRRSSSADSFLMGALGFLGAAVAIKNGGASPTMGSLSGSSTRGQGGTEASVPLHCLSYIDNQGRRIGNDAPGCIR